MRDESLEEKFQKLKLELERAQAVNEIRNIMSTLQCYHTAGLDSIISTLFAKRPDTKVYFGELGSFEGPDAPTRAGAGMPSGPTAGFLPMHLMVNPVIQVAEDCETAQAVFIAAGIVAFKDRKTGKPKCMWEWNRYGDDFIKEDGQWKLWHHHVYPLFQVDWDEKWADQFEKKGEGMELPIKPDHPATPLDIFYNPDAELPFIPIPKPYKTWADVEPY